MFGGLLKKMRGLLGGMEGGGAPTGAGATAPRRGILPTLGPGGTGGFAGNEGLPKLGAPPIGDAGLINRPQPMQNTLPQLQRPDAPQFDPIRDSANTFGQLPGGQLSVTPQQTQLIPQRQTSPVRPPDFLGRPGATMEDTPINHERYGYQTQFMQDGRIPRRWQDIAANALHGASQGFQGGGGWEGALGGAAAGGIGSAISPLHARDFRFQKEQLPRLQAQQGEAERLEDRGLLRRGKEADLAGTQARTAATIAGTKDAELERKYRTAQIEKLNAQAEAAALGRPVVKMITDENTGEIYEAQIYPDGRIERRGLSGTATLRREGVEAQNQRTGQQIEGRKGVATQNAQAAMERERLRQSGATGRTGMTQAGQDRRLRERLGAEYGDSAPIPYGPPVGASAKPPAVGSVPVKRATAGDIQEYAKQRGISAEEARKKFEAKGYRVE